MFVALQERAGEWLHLEIRVGVGSGAELCRETLQQLLLADHLFYRFCCFYAPGDSRPAGGDKMCQAVLAGVPPILLNTPA